MIWNQRIDFALMKLNSQNPNKSQILVSPWARWHCQRLMESVFEAGHALRLVTEDLLNTAIPFPNWLVTGRYTKGRGKDPGNYRPITCLNTQYNFATVVLADQPCSPR